MATALVVDDEVSVRSVVSEALRRQGFLVMEARGVREACGLSDGHDGEIDILIVNHLLSDGVGRHAVEQIRKSRPDIKVLRYSGYPREHLVTTGNIPADGEFLQKPFRAAELIEKVRDVLGWLPERRRQAGG